MFAENTLILIPILIIITLGGTTTAKPIYPGVGRRHNFTNPMSPEKTSPCDGSNKKPVRLEDDQIAKLRLALRDQTFLEKMADVQKVAGKRFNKMTSSSDLLKRPVVTFSQTQRRAILQHFGDMFEKRPDIHRQVEETFVQHRRSLTNDAVDVSESDDNVSRTLSNNGHRVCLPVQSYEALVISFDENNNPVQVVQFPEDDAQQWFMEESCQTDTSPVSSASCGVTSDRLVNAYVVNLTGDPPGDIKMGKIRVHSCVGFV